MGRRGRSLLPVPGIEMTRWGLMLELDMGMVVAVVVDVWLLMVEVVPEGWW